MELLTQVLRAGQSVPLRTAPARRRVLVLGGAGALGSAVLERLLGQRAFAEVAVALSGPLLPALQGLAVVSMPADPAVPPPTTADTAVLVFDRPRHANGRELSFYRPQPADLAALGAALHMAGVRQLVVVLPHDAATLPQALKAGLASLDEQSLAAQGFEQLVIIRAARDALAAREGPWLQRVALWVLSQVRWMIPATDKPVQHRKVAELALQCVLQLPRASHATRIAPPELVWAAAQTADVAGLVADWLGGRGVAAAPVPRFRG